ncbi:MAG: hypothetical protein F6K55_03260 [Moorea sp. SIO4A3]|nr:hypothetical protein [Moorena sp. SIO4A3]
MFKLFVDLSKDLLIGGTTINAIASIPIALITSLPVSTVLAATIVNPITVGGAAITWALVRSIKRQYEQQSQCEY